MTTATLSEVLRRMESFAESLHVNPRDSMAITQAEAEAIVTVIRALAAIIEVARSSGRGP